jgi:acetate kinase
MKKQLIQVINIGSSSLKISLFCIYKKRVERILDAHCRNIHDSNPQIEIVTQAKKTCIKHLKEGQIDKIFLQLMEEIEKFIDFHLFAIIGIGHRFIHGGDKYTTSMVINSSSLKELEKLKDLAPLHNPDCLKLIKASQKYFHSKMLQIAVFDTAFHSTLPSYASQYAIPHSLASKYHIKRYGFHGISHAYLTDKYFEYTKKKKRPSKLITLHLGNGCSATAILDGLSIDTSMGFSPAEGLVMGTRAGDIDFTLIEFLCKQQHQSVRQITHMLNFESGLKGISGKTSNVKELLQSYEKDPNCRLAIDMFCYRIIKYIGSFTTILNGVNAIIFSGGIGENSPLIRQMICSKLKWLGLKISVKRNNSIVNSSPGSVQKINTPSSSVELYVISTDENLFIAQEVLKNLN